MNIGIVPNPKRPEALALCAEVVKKVIQLDMNAFVPNRFIIDGLEDAVRCGDNEMYNKCDIIVAIGGDGTIIRCAKLAASKNISILGINAGRIGYLASLEPHQLEQLVKLKNNDYTVEERMLLRCDINGKISYALNDCVISRGAQSQLIDLKVGINGHIIPYRADGIIITTPTGSTAYSLAAGGPVLEPKTNIMVITPICPQDLFSRPLVLDGNSNITVCTESNDRDAYISVDGGSPQCVTKDDIINVSSAEHTVKIININNLSFYDVLSKKLR